MCQIAQYSDFILYGNTIDNWVGTHNLTISVDEIEASTDIIYMSYNDVFASGKHDWSWIEENLNILNRLFRKFLAY